MDFHAWMEISHKPSHFFSCMQRRPFVMLAVRCWAQKEFKFRFKLTEIVPVLIVEARPPLPWNWKVFDYVLRACINFIDLNWKIFHKFLITSPLLKLLVETSVRCFNFLSVGTRFSEYYRVYQCVVGGRAIAPNNMYVRLKLSLFWSKINWQWKRILRVMAGIFVW